MMVLDQRAVVAAAGVFFGGVAMGGLFFIVVEMTRVALWRRRIRRATWIAAGSQLDTIGIGLGVVRSSCRETDAEYRARILREIEIRNP
jgi:hypothetical protein